MPLMETVQAIRSTLDCQVFPPAGLPEIGLPHVLPNDLREFYEVCGGLRLFQSAGYPVFIVSPNKLILANPVIVGDVYEDDISSDWYIIADDGNGDYFTIDLNSERLGRCYDSSHETHALPGETPIVALSFTDFLARMLANKGQYWYFLQPDFDSLGDAYNL